MSVWTLLPTLSAPMSFQMALDEILFRKSSAASPTLRFYSSSEPWVTVGYSQKEGRSVPLPVCRRMTGGGRVLHTNDLMFSIVAAKHNDPSFGSVRMSYLKIHEAVKQALESLGCAPRFYRCTENLPRGADCFRYPIATDLAIGDTKVAGGAQKRSAGVLLHQESVQRVRDIGEEDLEQALRGGFEKIFGVQFESADWDPGVLSEAEKLAEEKYNGVRGRVTAAECVA